MTIGYAVVALTCVLLLPATLCQRENRECFCETGTWPKICNFTTVYCSPHDNNCNKENIVIGKVSKPSSSYGVSGTLTNEGCLANDGRMDTCFHTADKEITRTWDVFLERNYSIHEITIYGRKTHLQRMMDVIVEVNGIYCYRFPIGAIDPNIRERTDIQCPQALRGHRVTVRKSSIAGRTGDRMFLNFCEIQIWVCKPGLYGEKCDQFCSPQCKNCDNYDGRCWDGCDPGYYGIYCQNHCINCRDTVCDQQTGKCPKGCEKGFTGTTCTEACPADYHGYDCKQKCAGKCAGGQVCSRITGLCADGCDAGWSGASCSDKCASGTWGAGCKNKCAHCADKTVCEHVDGKCSDGCKAGYTGLKCTEDCKAGTYGPNCDKVCGACKKPTTCNSVSGLCPGGCDYGWMSPMCSTQCSLTTYGEDCKLKCDNCEEGQACDRVTGECYEGCKDGWHSALCNESCPLGTFGKNCSEDCSQCKNKNCSNEIGVCQDGCNSGYKGAYCKELEKAEAQSEKLPLGLIVGVALGGCALLMLIIVIIMLRAARKRLEGENEELQGLKKLDDVEAIQQEAPLHADGIEFQGISKDDQTITPQWDSPFKAEEIKASGENMVAEGQDVNAKPKVPKPDGSQGESGETRGTYSKGSYEESEYEDD